MWELWKHVTPWKVLWKTKWQMTSKIDFFLFIFKKLHHGCPFFLKDIDDAIKQYFQKQKDDFTCKININLRLFSVL